MAVRSARAACGRPPLPIRYAVPGCDGLPGYGAGDAPGYSMNRLTITQPDDWHVHFRDGEILSLVVPDTARRFGRAIAMPNLMPPITTTQQALAYRDRIQAAAPESSAFQALMTLRLRYYGISWQSRADMRRNAAPLR